MIMEYTVNPGLINPLIRLYKLLDYDYWRSTPLINKTMVLLIRGWHYHISCRIYRVFCRGNYKFFFCPSMGFQENHRAGFLHGLSLFDWQVVWQLSSRLDHTRNCLVAMAAVSFPPGLGTPRLGCFFNRRFFGDGDFFSMKSRTLLYITYRLISGGFLKIRDPQVTMVVFNTKSWSIWVLSWPASRIQRGSKMGDPYPPRRWLLGVGFRSAIGGTMSGWGWGWKRSPWVRGIQAGLYIFVFKTTITTATARNCLKLGSQSHFEIRKVRSLWWRNVTFLHVPFSRIHKRWTMKYPLVKLT